MQNCLCRVATSRTAAEGGSGPWRTGHWSQVWRQASMGGGVAATLPPPGLTHPGPQPQGQGHSMPGLCVSERHSVLCLLLPKATPSCPSLQILLRPGSSPPPPSIKHRRAHPAPLRAEPRVD